MATRFVVLALLCLGLTCGFASAQNLLANPDFEAGDTGWTKFANAFIEGTPNGDPCISPQSGSWCAKMFGNWWGVFNVSGMFQEFPANAGEQFSMDCWSRHCATDPMIGGGAPNDNWVVMKIAFFDAGANEIAGAEQTVCDGTSPLDTWIDNPAVLATAPAGTATVQALLLYLQPLFDGGAVQIDDVSFSQALAGDTPATATPAPSSLCGGTSVSGDTSTMTASGENPSCGASSGNDAWYEFTAATTGTMSFDLCGSAYDTVLSAFDGTPGALNEVVCNDDSCGLQSAISIATTAGTQYFIRVGGFSSGSGAYTLTEGGLGGSVNTAESSLDIDGTNAATVCGGSSATLNVSTSLGAGALHDVGVSSSPLVTTLLIDDCIELDLANTASVWTGGAVALPLLPFGGGLSVSSLSVGFVPNAGEYDLQMGILDAGDPDGVSMSQRAHLSVIGTVIALSLGDDDNIQMSGPCFTDVNFYGAMYDHCYVGSNGDVTFTAGSSDFTQTYGEWASSMPRIGWAADLQPNVYGTVTFNGLSDGFRVDYTDMSEWGTGGLGVISYSVEVSASAGASITGMTEDGTWGGTAQCLGASNGSLGTDPGQADFAALFAGGGAGAGAATDMWVDAAGGMISGAGSTYSNILFPAADGSSIAIN